MAYSDQEPINRELVRISNEIDFSNDLQSTHRWEEKYNFCPPQVVVVLVRYQKSGELGVMAMK